MAQGGEKVVLHIYDLSNGLARQLSASILGKAIDAVYHTGVVVYGREYSFGAGIESECVGLGRYGTPFQALDLGYTEVPKELFDEYLEEIRPRYTAETYSLLRHNCNNFSDELVQFLVGANVPSHILNLPNEVLSTPFGASLLPMLEQIEAGARARAYPQSSAAAGAGPPMGPVPNFASVKIPAPAQSPLSTANIDSSRSYSTPATTASASATSATLSATRGVGHVPADSASRATSATQTPSTQVSGVTQGTPAGAESAQNRQSLVPEATGESGSVEEGDVEAKARVHREIQREFAVIMAAGQLKANEAAVQAVRRVMERKRTSTMTSNQPQA